MDTHRNSQGRENNYAHPKTTTGQSDRHPLLPLSFLCWEARCVRRAFLCGEDALTGQSYEHRRGWVEARLLLLSSVFSIKVCSYAVMSNHTHTVLHVDEEQAQNWSIHDVLERWHRLHKGTLFTQQYVKGELLPDFTLALVESSAEVYRNRLMDISWFMKELNEPIARQANIEDACTGRLYSCHFMPLTLRAS